MGMQNVINRRWRLASYPAGMPSLENWTMDTQPVPDPGLGQIVIKAKWLSVDPYMRGRMSPAAGYTKGVSIGEVMQGGGVGEVVASNHPTWKVGDIAESMSVGWQEWAVLTPDIFGPAGVNKIDPKLAPIESSLSWLGMPGVTAYFGLLDVGRPRPGETVVVSAASGAVGQLVGQIAKLAGCRAVAIAGDDEKLRWCRELGFDAAINYKKSRRPACRCEGGLSSGRRCLFRQHSGTDPRRGHEKLEQRVAGGDLRPRGTGRPVRQAGHRRAVHGPADRHARQRARLPGIRLVAPARRSLETPRRLAPRGPNPLQGGRTRRHRAHARGIPAIVAGQEFRQANRQDPLGVTIAGRTWRRRGDGGA